MARKSRNANGTISLIATETVIGVELRKEINLGGTDTTAGTTRVRPTNVTATIAAEPGVGEDASGFILLHNGPAGGFTQNFKAAAGDYEVNEVIEALITDA